MTTDPARAPRTLAELQAGVNRAYQQVAMYGARVERAMRVALSRSATPIEPRWWEDENGVDQCPCHAPQSPGGTSETATA